METQDIKTRVSKIMADNGLEIQSTFIPFSQSRNSKEKNPSLNYKVTLTKNGKEILTTDYSMGCAHCPSYKQGDNSHYRNEAVKKESETGFMHRPNERGIFLQTKEPIKPDAVDVLYSLLLDADAVNSPDFEEWAGNYDYDTDSRTAEKLYRQCLEIGLKLQNSLGRELTEQLQEIFQDY